MGQSACFFKIAPINVDLWGQSGKDYLGEHFDFGGTMCGLSSQPQEGQDNETS